VGNSNDYLHSDIDEGTASNLSMGLSELIYSCIAYFTALECLFLLESDIGDDDPYFTDFAQNLSQ